MWLDRRCILCLVHSRVGDAVKLGRTDVVPALLDRLKLRVTDPSRSRAFADSFRDLAQLMAAADPYAEYKRRLVEVGRRAAQIARKIVAGSGWDVRVAARVSAAANIIDSNVLGYSPAPLEEALKDEPAIEEWVEPGDRVAIVLDNAGEAEVDAVLAEALDRSGRRPMFVVRAEPYEIDVTVLDAASSYPIYVSPGNTPPILSSLPQADTYLVKGIANMEAYLEARPRIEALLLFRAKCDVLPDIFSVPRNAPIMIRGETAARYADAYRA